MDFLNGSTLRWSPDPIVSDERYGHSFSTFRSAVEPMHPLASHATNNYYGSTPPDRQEKAVEHTRDRGFTLTGDEDSHYMRMDRNNAFRRSMSLDERPVFNYDRDGSGSGTGLNSNANPLLEATYVEMKSQHEYFKRLEKEMEEGLQQQQQKQQRRRQDVVERPPLDAGVKFKSGLPSTVQSQPAAPPPPPPPPFVHDTSQAPDYGDYSWVPPPRPFNQPDHPKDCGCGINNVISATHDHNNEGGSNSIGSNGGVTSQTLLLRVSGGSSGGGGKEDVGKQDSVSDKGNHHHSTSDTPSDPVTNISTGTVATRVNMFDTQRRFQQQPQQQQGGHGNVPQQTLATGYHTSPKDHFGFSPRQVIKISGNGTDKTTTTTDTTETGYETTNIVGVGMSGDRAGVEFGTAHLMNYSHSVPRPVLKKVAMVNGLARSRDDGLERSRDDLSEATSASHVPWVSPAVRPQQYSSRSGNEHVTVVSVHDGERRQPPQTLHVKQGPYHPEKDGLYNSAVETASSSYNATSHARDSWSAVSSYRPTLRNGLNVVGSSIENNNNKVLEVMSQKISVLMDTIDRQNKRLDGIQHSLDRQRTRFEETHPRSDFSPSMSTTYRSMDVLSSEPACMVTGGRDADHKNRKSKEDKQKKERKKNEVVQDPRVTLSPEKRKWTVMSCVR